MRKTTLAFAVVAILLMAMKSDNPAYRIFNNKGKQTTYAKLLKSALEADIILFGELHSNPICHWLQLELTKDLYAEAGDKLILGAEMFEQDGQVILDEYVSGIITKKNFESQIRLWPNYKTDYRPLVEFARDHEIPFIATNIPRRYASLVFREGFEGLEKIDEQAGQFIAPLPIPYDKDLPGYKELIEMAEQMENHSPDFFPQAQAIKDATMAHFILENMKEGQLFIHYNGTYHSNNYEGIIWYLNKYRPGYKIMSISSVEQESITSLEEFNTGVADFTLATPDNMTKTHVSSKF